MRGKHITLILVFVVAGGMVLALVVYVFGNFSGRVPPVRVQSYKATRAVVKEQAVSAPPAVPRQIEYVGPRGNVPDDAPTAYGFWSFAIPVPGVLSRSGQPLMSEFQWLADQGWGAVVNVRVDGERGEMGDDAKLSGFSDLGLNYLHLPITDGHPPTAEQAEQFLAFVANPENRPVHIHCRGGIGRAGTMTALYRYAVQGWPMEQAIEESRLFKGGVSSLQEEWLDMWAVEHQPGSHAQM